MEKNVNRNEKLAKNLKNDSAYSRISRILVAIIATVALCIAKWVCKNKLKYDKCQDHL